MELIGRTHEKKIFERFYNSSEASFLALYGRRRVGKTYLVRQLFEHRDIYFEVTGRKDGRQAVQLLGFSDALEQTFGSQGVSTKEIKSWRQAFEQLTRCLQNVHKDKACVLFFDELPWLATQGSGLLQELDYFWNTRWSRDKRIKLIVCGSAASWILNKLIHAKGGLYNRLTDTILLEPFLLHETSEYLAARGIEWTPELVVDLYMVTGGVPHYLNQPAMSEAPAETIQRMCFSQDGLLFAEFDDLFSSLFVNADRHVRLVREIAKRRKGMARNELLTTLGLKSGGSLNRRLEELQATGFVQRFVPYGKRLREQYFRIADEYTLFYLSWIEAVRMRGLPVPKHHWQARMQTPAWRSWSGYAFEDLCLKHADAILAALGISGVACEIGSWSFRPKPGSDEQGAQIDMIIDRADKVISLCEMKYSATPFIIDKAYSRELQRKMAVFKLKTRTKKMLQIVLVTSYGLQRNNHAEALHVKEVCLTDLFQ